MKTSKLYVGNLNYQTDEEQLRELFSQYGTVSSINIIEGKGFAFVEMDQSGAEAAIQALNGQEMGGRSLRVNEAHERGRGGPSRRQNRDRY